MLLIVFIKRFLLLFNIMTIITILSYLYVFNIRTSDSGEIVIPLTLKPSSLKKTTYKKNPKQITQYEISNVTNLYTMIVTGLNFNSSFKIDLEVRNSTEPSIEYYDDESKTTTTTSTSTTTASTTTTTTLTLKSNVNSISIELPLCPLIPENLGKRIKIIKEKRTLDELNKFFANKVLNGGESLPNTCKSRHKVAIIVPYRGRETNLIVFLRNIHPFLIKQQIHYGIYIIEPLANLTFNRGLLMNIGFLESLKLSNEKWECFMFHDVDLLPEDERNIYSCPTQTAARHMSGAVSTFKYILPYDTIFGGVSSLTKDQMIKVNGYSNLYFGWGGEDDDFRARIVKHGYQITRYPLEIARYLMATHEKDKNANPQRFKLLNSAKQRSDKEGLNSIKYEVVKIDSNFLYTRLFVKYDEALIKKDYNYDLPKEHRHN